LLDGSLVGVYLCPYPLLFCHQLFRGGLLSSGPFFQVLAEDYLFLIALEIRGLQERESVVDSGNLHGLIRRLLSGFLAAGDDFPPNFERKVLRCVCCCH
jgi:hypothetical protein